MATERLSMRKIREILRQKWEMGRTHRAIAQSVGLKSPGTVSSTIARAEAAGLSWAAVSALSDEELEKRLYGTQPGSGARNRPVPDWSALHIERRRPNVTLQLLHVEYLERHADGYQYSQFCEMYREWLGRRGLSMRQVHVAGDKMFVDYAGKKAYFVDAATGECVGCELFVAVLGASNYTFAEATRTQQSHDFIGSHVRAFEFFEGVAAATVCDQLRSGVSTTCRYEPTIQRTYEELALHYGTTVLPARPASPRDKAKVEVAVQVAERWILARLRNEQHFSLNELNARITELLDELNDRRMRVYGQSRRALFEQLDRPALKSLPGERFTHAQWKKCRVNIDYHVEVDSHYYSVPHSLIHEEVDARFTATTVELFHQNKRVATHVRSVARGRHTTTPEHMPKAHQKHLEWTPQRLIDWARKMGPQTGALVERILAERRHPEQGYRSCLGLLRLGKRYGEARLEAACARAFAAGARSYRHVESILKNGLDRSPISTPNSEFKLEPTTHENVRGPKYYN